MNFQENFKYVQAPDFKGILQKFTLRWVKINRGGPETLEGVMDVVTDNFVTIVANEEIIRVSLFHIRNISYGVKLDKPDGKKDKEDNKSKAITQKVANTYHKHSSLQASLERRYSMKEAPEIAGATIYKSITRP